MIIGDFNVDINNNSMKEFCELYDLKNLIKEPTCFKSNENPSCIDLMLTNRYRSFCNSCVIETGLSDFHRMTVTVLKISFKRLEPNIISYRNYQSFCNDSFREVFVSEIQKSGSNIKTIPMNKCIDICNETLNRFAPLKTKYVRANNKSFMSKEISKAIMTRTRLRNKYFKIKTII